jgi:signal transduction histidine kinase
VGFRARFADERGEKWLYLWFAIPMMLVISVSLVLQWAAVWNWTLLVAPQEPMDINGALGIWSFGFIPALIGVAALLPFYPAGRPGWQRLTLAAVFSLLAGVLRFGAEYLLFGRMFVSGPMPLELTLAFGVPMACITVSMYLARTQTQAMLAERRLAAREFQARQAALERENEELKLRRQLSSVLHDHVQQRLVFLASQMEEIVPHAVDAGDQWAVQRLHETIRELDRLREDDVRQLSHSLFPVGADIGLHQAVALIVGRVPATIQVDLSVSDAALQVDSIMSPEMDMADRAVMANALEEGITNAVKHGGAHAIEVSLDLEQPEGERTVVLTVRNDGQPLDPARRLSGLGYLKFRAEARGGGLSLLPGADSRPELKVWLPLRPVAPSQPAEVLHAANG